ncbi:hypothetical protein MH216_03820, partial [Paenibacillus larvae]
ARGAYHPQRLFLRCFFTSILYQLLSKVSTGCKNMGFWVRWLQKAFVKNFFDFLLTILPTTNKNRRSICWAAEIKLTK